MTQFAGSRARERRWRPALVLASRATDVKPATARAALLRRRLRHRRAPMVSSFLSPVSRKQTVGVTRLTFEFRLPKICGIQSALIASLAAWPPAHAAAA